jgi:hypothetical protein
MTPAKSSQAVGLRQGQKAGYHGQTFVGCKFQPHLHEIDRAIEVVHLSGKLEKALFAHCLNYNHAHNFFKMLAAFEEFSKENSYIERIILGDK